MSDELKAVKGQSLTPPFGQIHQRIGSPPTVDINVAGLNAVEGARPLQQGQMTPVEVQLHDRVKPIHHGEEHREVAPGVQSVEGPDYDASGVHGSGAGGVTRHQEAAVAFQGLYITCM